MIDLLELYRGGSDPERLMPFNQSHAHEVSFRINNLTPTTDLNSWTIEYTRKSGDLAPVRYRVTVSPEQRWWITDLLAERNGEFRMESQTTHQQVGDLFMPIASSTHSTSADGEYDGSLQLKPLSDAECRELQLRVEQAIKACPSSSYERWCRILLTTAIACPAVGLLLVGIARKSNGTA